MKHLSRCLVCMLNIYLYGVIHHFTTDSKKQFRLLLFPETNQGHYYRIVFGRIIPWGIAFSALLFIFTAGMKAIENWKYRVHDETIENRVEAWTYLREYGGKEINQEMNLGFG